VLWPESVHGDGEREAAPLPRRARHVDGPAVRLRGGERNRESEAATADVRSPAEEALEQVLLVLFADAGTTVLDQPRDVIVLGPHGHLDGGAVRREALSVREDVAERLHEAGTVPPDLEWLPSGEPFRDREVRPLTVQLCLRSHEG